MKIKIIKSKKIQLQDLNKNIGKVVKSYNDFYYLITKHDSKILLVNLHTFRSWYPEVISGDFEVIESELIIHE